jgi:hypothetical protein
MLMQKQYAFSRNQTSNFELDLFLGWQYTLLFSLQMQGNHSSQEAPGNTSPVQGAVLPR